MSVARCMAVVQHQRFVANLTRPHELISASVTWCAQCEFNVSLCQTRDASYNPCHIWQAFYWNSQVNITSWRCMSLLQSDVWSMMIIKSCTESIRLTRTFGQLMRPVPSGGRVWDSHAPLGNSWDRYHQVVISRDWYHQILRVQDCHALMSMAESSHSHTWHTSIRTTSKSIFYFRFRTNIFVDKGNVKVQDL